MNNPLGPSPTCGLRQLERDAAAVGAALVRRSVEIAGSVEDQATVRVVPVLAVGVEVMQDLLGPSPTYLRRQLEDDSGQVIDRIPVRATLVGCAIKIAGGIEDESTVSDVSVSAVIGEAVQNFLLLREGAGSRHEEDCDRHKQRRSNRRFPISHE